MYGVRLKASPADQITEPQPMNRIVAVLFLVVGCGSISAYELSTIHYTNNTSEIIIVRMDYLPDGDSATQHNVFAVLPQSTVTQTSPKGGLLVSSWLSQSTDANPDTYGFEASESIDPVDAAVYHLEFRRAQSDSSPVIGVVVAQNDFLVDDPKDYIPSAILLAVCFIFIARAGIRDGIGR